MALSGHAWVHRKCPLLGAKRTSRVQCRMSTKGQKRTLRLLRNRRPVVCHFSLAARSQSARLRYCTRRGPFGGHMQRREFITLLGGAAAAWPLAARAQQPERVRRIGVLLPAGENDAEFQTWLRAFLQELAQLGWTIGLNVRIETRWAGGNADDIRRHAGELVALAPDVILAHGASTAGPLLHATRTVPVVFPVVFDPVGAGLVESLARPGGNATGFMTTEYSAGGKWLELLKQIAPSVTRV